MQTQILVLAAVLALGGAVRAADPPAPAPAASPAGAGIPLPSVRVALSARGLTLTGVVPDGLERDLIVRRARQLYGIDRVTDLLQVAEVGNPAWLNADFLPDLSGATAATAVLENGGLLVEGDVASRDALDRISAALAALRQRGVVVDNRLRHREDATTAR